MIFDLDDYLFFFLLCLQFLGIPKMPHIELDFPSRLIVNEIQYTCRERCRSTGMPGGGPLFRA